MKSELCFYTGTARDKLIAEAGLAPADIVHLCEDRPDWYDREASKEWWARINPYLLKEKERAWRNVFGDIPKTDNNWIVSKTWDNLPCELEKLWDRLTVSWLEPLRQNLTIVEVLQLALCRAWREGHDVIGLDVLKPLVLEMMPYYHLLVYARLDRITSKHDIKTGQSKVIRQRSFNSYLGMQLSTSTMWSLSGGGWHIQYGRSRYDKHIVPKKEGCYVWRLVDGYSSGHAMELVELKVTRKVEVRKVTR